MRIPSRLEVQASLVRRRVARMRPEQMGMWMDTAGSEMSRAFHQYLRTGEGADLEEFDRGVATLLAMSQVLHDRKSL